MKVDLVFAPEPIDDVWHQRWKSLVEFAEELFALALELRGADPLSTARLNEEASANCIELGELLERICAWGDRQLYFLYHGFEADKGYTLDSPATLAADSSDKFPKNKQAIKLHYEYGGWRSAQSYKEYILSRTLNQLAYDMLIVQMAVAQRRDSTSSSRVSLEETDILAAAALEMFEDPHIETHCNAITFFRTTPAARVVPYAHLPIIGIPLTARSIMSRDISVVQDILAIPHEIGHQLYWRAMDPTIVGDKDDAFLAPVAEQFTHFITPYEYKEWAEEIFADVIGCLIGGPIVALSAMDLALSHPPSSFKPKTKTDLLVASHPAPYIRPLIYTYVIRHYLDIPNREEIADRLEQYWIDKVAARGEFIEPEWLGTIELDKAFWPDDKIRLHPVYHIVREVFKVRFNFQDDVISNLHNIVTPFSWKDLMWSNGEGEINCWIRDFATNLPEFLEKLVEFINKNRYYPNWVDSDDNSQDSEPVPKDDLWADLPLPVSPRFWLSQLGVYLSNELQTKLEDQLPEELTGNAVKTDVQEAETVEIQADIWLRIFEFGGWITEDGNNSGVSGHPYQ